MTPAEDHIEIAVNLLELARTKEAKAEYLYKALVHIVEAVYQLDGAKHQDSAEKAE